MVIDSIKNSPWKSINKFGKINYYVYVVYFQSRSKGKFNLEKIDLAFSWKIKTNFDREKNYIDVY